VHQPDYSRAARVVEEMMAGQMPGNYGVVADMTQAVEALLDDPETLKAMLIAERIRSERLVQTDLLLDRTMRHPVIADWPINYWLDLTI
jgi:hypothetical protein